MDTTGLKRPVVRLVGEDGNAFAILGRVRRTMRQAGWPKDAIDGFMAEATSGNYDYLLATVLDHCDEPADDNGEQD